VKAYILAGGGGSRLAPNKGFLTVGGVPIVERVRAAAAPLVSETVLVGPAGQLACAGQRVVTEEEPGAAGPLGGVCAALSDASPGDALILPWDAPFVNTEALAYLVDVRGSAHAAVPRRGEQIEPLFAVYGPACLSPAEEALRRGERRVIAFYPGITVRWVEPEELAPFGDWEALFFNVNTPADLARARETAASIQGDER
jgi:molybdopterin-guanine dinucleotide biosynthesis protein A